MGLEINNIASLATLNKKIDQNYILSNLEDTKKYLKYNAVIHKNNSPKATYLLFTSGKIIIVGTNSIKNSKKAIQTISDKLKNIGIDVKILESKITNITCTLRLKYRINLNIFKNENLSFISHEPEIFPAVYYKDPKYNILALVYYQGRIVLTGGNKMKEYKDFVKSFSKKVKACKKH